MVKIKIKIKISILGPWRRMSGAQRGRIMFKFADLLE